jgi:glycosyltransferase involved in cell wall biosynthesis
MKITSPKYEWRNYNFGDISLCMIMKNEEKVLRRCLDSVAGLVNEIIIVDTGSTDKSVEIAKSYGATVLYDKWQDDFARPRNIGIEKATCQWILIMDPDEIISKTDHTAIKWLTRSQQIVAFWVTTFNYSMPTGEANYISLNGKYDPSGKFPGFTPSTKTRFFKNGLGIHFEGCWHELVDWYIARNKLKIGSSDVPIHHWNHEISQTSIKEKGLLYLRLGEKKVKEWPTSGQAWWELAVAEMIQGLRVRASHSITQAIKYGFNSQHQFFALARCRHLLNDNKLSSLAFEKGVCRLYPSLTHIEPSKRPLDAIIEAL